jgi:hypothetical protein
VAKPFPSAPEALAVARSAGEAPREQEKPDEKRDGDTPPSIAFVQRQLTPRGFLIPIAIVLSAPAHAPILGSLAHAPPSMSSRGMAVSAPSLASKSQWRRRSDQFRSRQPVTITLSRSKLLGTAYGSRESQFLE